MTSQATRSDTCRHEHRSLLWLPVITRHQLRGHSPRPSIQQHKQNMQQCDGILQRGITGERGRDTPTPTGIHTPTQPLPIPTAARNDIPTILLEPKLRSVNPVKKRTGSSVPVGAQRGSTCARVNTTKIVDQVSTRRFAASLQYAHPHTKDTLQQPCALMYHRCCSWPNSKRSA
jgi:hypothetical protein